MSGESVILQTNPKGAYLAQKLEIDAAVARVLNGGWYIMGEEVRAFEAEFAAFVGAEHGLGVGNGTDAIELSLRALGVSRGDAVFTVSHTAVATVAAIERTGATPVLVDIDPQTYTLSPDALTHALKNSPPGLRPAAVVVVHLYGHAADMASLLDISRKHSLPVVEDCAQSHGARWTDKTTGTMGALGAFSFYPTKNLGAFGDGGMVVTSDPELAAKVKRLREYGWEPRFISQVAGVNSRLDELHAAMLRVCLRRLAENNARRRQIAAAYDAALADSGLTLPIVRQGCEHVYHQYVLRTKRRDALKEWLAARGVGTAIHYPQPVHLQPAYEGRIPLGGAMTVTERIASEILSLPMHPWLSDPDVQRVIDGVQSWVAATPR